MLNWINSTVRDAVERSLPGALVDVRPRDDFEFAVTIDVHDEAPQTHRSKRYSAQLLFSALTFRVTSPDDARRMIEGQVHSMVGRFVSEYPYARFWAANMLAVERAGELLRWQEREAHKARRELADSRRAIAVIARSPKKALMKAIARARAGAK